MKLGKPSPSASSSLSVLISGRLLPVYEAVLGGVLGGFHGVVHEQHVGVAAVHLVGDVADGFGAALVPYVADVDGPDALRVLAEDLAVSLGVLLAGITYEDEREVRVVVQDAPDHLYLVLLVVHAPQHVLEPAPSL